MPGRNPSPGRTSLADALAMEVERVDADTVTAHANVHDGFDVFGIPHGGYLAALGARAVLLASEQPDLFTVTTHYLRKATVGAFDLTVRRLGASRRFATWQATATQDGRPVIAMLASVGDRNAISGPSWSDTPAWRPDDGDLTPMAGDPDLAFTTPRVAEQFGMRFDVASSAFAQGRRSDQAMLRATLDTDQPDQLTALVACDLSPPAAWNPLGPSGWVPTVELTAHVRARPAPGQLSIEVASHHVADGFLDEEALVRDATGTLVVQSRQLARWTD